MHLYFLGQVWSWGDDDCGKSGRGASDGCKTPKLIEKLQDLDVVRVRCGSQFSIALTKDDQVYSWGKGDNQRRGHGPEGHVRYPKLLEGLRGKKVIDAAAGSTHCLALTEDSEVHSSGSNDQCQHFDTLRVTKPEPAALPGLDTKHTVGIACGPAQDIEAQKEAQKGKEVDEQEANASTFHTSRTPLDKDLVNTGICESSGKRCLPLVQLIQQLLSPCEILVSIVLEGRTRRRCEEVRLSQWTEANLGRSENGQAVLSEHDRSRRAEEQEKAEPWQVGSGS
uniref:E3 ubiquitin-protein ligase HERC2-like n=1 Tax=Macaca mulatta TaxID=9544 RepID=UPI0010A24027|nr:E3 ubiquitin-protein ligase HERC2-like [Macaca mulatta]